MVHTGNWSLQVSFRLRTSLKMKLRIQMVISTLFPSGDVKPSRLSRGIWVLQALRRRAQTLKAVLETKSRNVLHSLEGIYLLVSVSCTVGRAL